MTSKDTLEHLYSKIQQNRKQATSGEWFVPQYALRAVFSEKAIKDAVNEINCAPQDRMALAADIYSHGTITFAILVFMRQWDHIVKFRSHDCFDSRLPLRDEALAKEIAPEFGSYFVEEWQWQFLPYNFPEYMHYHHRDIPREYILPIIEEQDFGKGAFGVVSKVWLPSAMQAFTGLQSDRVRQVPKVHRWLANHSQSVTTCWWSGNLSPPRTIKKAASITGPLIEKFPCSVCFTL
jgi:hypothetical protein